MKTCKHVHAENIMDFDNDEGQMIRLYRCFDCNVEFQEPPMELADQNWIKIEQILANLAKQNGLEW